MHFRAIVKTICLISILSTIAFVLYTSKIATDEPVKVLVENSQAMARDNAVQDEDAEVNSITAMQKPVEMLDESTQAMAQITSAQDEDAFITSSSSYVQEDVIITLSFLGDVALGQDMRYLHADSFNYVFEKEKGNYSYFFSNVVDILSQDDLTIANLETTLANETKKAEKYDYGNNYWFIGKPEYANILRAGSIEAANLANNHTYDYGQTGYDATRKALEDAGVEYFGYSEALYKEIKGIKIGIAGFNQLGNYEQGLDMTEFKKEVKEMTERLRSECDLVIANFHWGKEYKYTQEALQEELAYLAIDSGADLVIGHHPHVLQPIAEYKGKYIAYSLGNFCFGGVKRPKDYDTAIFQQSFVFDSDKVLQPVNEPKVIPCSVSSRSDLNIYQPAVAKEPQYSSVLKKLKFSPVLSAEEKAARAAKTDMVRLDAAVKDIVFDLKYASTDNIVGKVVYEDTIAYARKGTADKLDKANQILLKQGYKIKVWDAYRQQKYQQFLYDNAPVKAIFMDPKKAPSNHTRGAAIDCTLVTLDGEEVDMPSGFDDGTALASRKYDKCTKEQKQNALILENAMKSAGFIPLSTEWWHFDDTEYKSYPAIASYTE